MRILLDQGTPVPLRHQLGQHRVETTYERGWSALENGELLATAEVVGFAVFVATDSNLKYQQNLSQRRIAIVVLSTTSWPRIRAAGAQILQAIESALPGAYVEVPIP